jgi:alpha-glucosidase
MVGEDVLVAPILKPDVTRRLVYLPAGTWYDYWTNKKHTGGTTITVDAPLDTAPIFVRGGAMIPTTTPRNYVGEKPDDPITFAIYPDDNGAASGALYEDDGTSPAYRHGMFLRTRVSARRDRRGFNVSVEGREGQFNPGARKLNFVLKGQRSTAITVIKT